MTRMLCSLLACLLIVSVFGGCSSNDSDNDSTISEVDKESAGIAGLDDDNLLDAEDEMLAESSDLAAAGEDEFTDEIDGGDEFSDEAEGAEDFGGDVAINDEESLDSEFESASLDQGMADEDDFGDEDEFSDTNDNQVDQQLAQDEFSDFDDEDFGEAEPAQDEFALDAQPADELEPGAEQAFNEQDTAPVIDVPQENMTFASNTVTNLEYKAYENGGTVVIETQEPASFQKIVDPDRNQIIIQVNDVSLPARFQRPYITKDFKQDIATINAYSSDSGSARFVIQMKRPVDPAVAKDGNSIFVMTGKSTMASFGNQQPGPGEQPLNQLVSENEIKPNEGGIEGSMTLSEADPGTNTKPQAQSALGTQKGSKQLLTSSGELNINEGRYIGDPISLEFVEEDVRTIIEVIAEKSGINLIMDQEVSGTTSIRLRDVPWDQALLVLLRSQGLGYVKQGSVLRIARQATLSQEAESVSAQIKSEKQAKLLSSGLKVKYIPVSYAKVSELSNKLKEFLSKEGKIAFDDRTSSLVITDFGEFIDRIEELVRALDTPPMQVEIESKLVEAREDFIREAGINWRQAGQAFDVSEQTATINSGLNGIVGNTSGFSLDLSIGTFDIFGDLTAALNIFENQNKIKVLSQPRVVTMNKVPAVIEQVTQVPIEQTTIVNNVPTITFNFQDLTLSLAVTPQITFKGDVILDVELRREFAGAEAGDGTRELNRRRAKTTVMVKNGKTAVIGGIYQLDDTDIDSGIPVLKDVPLIGYLFKQTRKSKSKNELLLFLKPKILKEIEGPMVSKAAPAQGANYDPFEELSVDEGDNAGDALNIDEVDAGESISDDDFGDEDLSGSTDDLEEEFSEAELGGEDEEELSLEL